MFLYLAVNFINNVTWRRVDNTTLEFTCEVACRTPSITGCDVQLQSDSGARISNVSTVITGENEMINSRFVTVIVNNLKPTAEYSYTTAARVIENGLLLITNNLMGTIPAAVECKDTYVVS